MRFKDLVSKNRSYRRFDETVRIEERDLAELVELARLTPSAGNMQPLKYIISASPQRNEKIFSCLAWAAYLQTWNGPEEGERPAGYIVILGDTTIKEDAGCDHGIAAQTIMLGAVEQGLGGCIFASIKRDRLRQLLDIPEKYSILLVLALGKPSEQVVLETVGDDGDIRYWRDASGAHHVPKRSLDELLVEPGEGAMGTVLSSPKRSEV